MWIIRSTSRVERWKSRLKLGRIHVACQAHDPWRTWFNMIKVDQSDGFDSTHSLTTSDTFVKDYLDSCKTALKQLMHVETKSRLTDTFVTQTAPRWSLCYARNTKGSMKEAKVDLPPKDSRTTSLIQLDLCEQEGGHFPSPDEYLSSQSITIFTSTGSAVQGSILRSFQ
jgi:hypothetical protein